MKKSITLCSLIFFSGVVSAQGYSLSCDDSRLLFPKQTLSTDDSLDVLADRSEISKGDTYLLTGNVSLNSSAYFLAADEIQIKKTDKTSTAKGGVKYQDDELMFVGESAVVKKKADNNHITLQQVSFHYPESKMNGKASQVVNDGVSQVFDSVSYTLCPLGNTDWQMKADQITLNSDTNRGVASDVVVEFLGVPIFYAPHHEWVLEGRGSGFLAPSFGSYHESVADQNNNYQVRIPYYFNIAADRDLLLSLNQLSSRGSIIEAKYRQLITANDYVDGGRFEIEGHYLNEDKITKNKRWLLNSTIDLALNDKTDLNITTNRVSDKDYFKEIAHTNTSGSALNSKVDLTFEDADKNLNMVFFAESEQLINSGTSKYTRAPELSISKGFTGLDNRRMDLSLVSTKFANKDSSYTTGIRTHAQANFSRSITTDAYSLTPKLNLSTTDYALDNTTNESRSIYSVGLDSKLFLEREVNLFGTDLIQTLTPRLAYNYTPEKTDPSVNFDSESKSDSYESLFSGQKFTGIDRIGKANDLTFGLESDFIDEETGETYLSLKSAQSFYADAVSPNGSDRKYSDIAMSANITLDDLSFNNSLEFDPETNKIDKRDSSMSYILNPRKFLTLAHHDDNGTKSAELYGAYPITQNVHVFAGINRSITNSITNKETTGIAYESCCWALRLAHFKKHISGNDYDYITNFELVLKGLASTSPGLAARLEEEVPNYLANLKDL
ncbi:LPS assembly protein LptD [Candidatus Thioglobus sp.]|uniref:LPS-assembly protein LptD n=1 Tax=Candidatus Thioglobus sp. TaxID=2026721 RepID=UPI0025C4F671|nr:LPS assembly protein LptD [Candidatus Thioglobus sp.]